MREPGLKIPLDAAKAYEAFLVPALFGQWSVKVADAAEIQAGVRVLDVACGTGILGREVFSRTGLKGRVVGIDRDPGMIAVAKQLAPGIDWREGEAEALPFPDRSFDAVVSQFSLMFFRDRHQALREMLRVVTPAGRVAVAVWDSLTQIPAYASEVAILEHTAGRRAADALRAPFVLGNGKDLARLFTEAGAAQTEITTQQGMANFPSIRSMVEADLRGWLPLMGVILTEEEINRILHAAEQALASYATADGRVRFPLSAHIVTARKP
jgi:SAM-dependent methyltransferase